jgi:uncharacterized protein YbjT (DUF2867 family)
MSSEAPVIAIVGATGYIGKLVTPELYNALKEKRIKELRILTRKVSPALEKTALEHGATAHEVVYSDSSSLQKALSGVDVLISISYLLVDVDRRYDGSSGVGLGTK